MNLHRSRLWLACAAFVGCALLFLHNQASAQQAPPKPEAGVEVLARGPVHEAFAEPIVFDSTPGLVVRSEPPEPIEEMPPDQKPAGSNVVWIPGYWSWDDDRDDFLWVSGFWRTVPPDREWVPGYWARVSSGFQWISGYWAADQDQSTEYLPEPPENIETGPNTEPLSANQIWVPGCWYWADTRYVWRPGYWVEAQPDWIWVPAHYVWSPRGHIFVDGYWDYSIARRGLLFAPVYFDRPVYARPGYYYSPSIVIDVGILTDHFFVRPYHHHYYFGDYYADQYFNLGIFPWFSFHLSRLGYDPIYAYHHHHHGRRDRDWDDRIREQYRHRREQKEDRPPRTFAAVAATAERGERDDNDRFLVKRLDQVASAKQGAIRLEKVTDQQRKDLAKNVHETRQFTKERVRLEADGTTMSREKQPNELQTKEKAQTGPTTERQAKKGKVKLQRPKSPIMNQSKSGERKDRVAPARPEAPQPDPKVQAVPRGKQRPRPDPQIELRRQARLQPRTGDAKRQPQESHKQEYKPKGKDTKPSGDSNKGSKGNKSRRDSGQSKPKESKGDKPKKPPRKG